MTCVGSNRDRAGRIVVEVDRNEWLVVGVEHTLQRAGSCLLDCTIDLRDIRVARGIELEIDERTFGVGTRMEVPSSLPFNSGKTKPTAFAAPVEVGISDSTPPVRGACRNAAYPLCAGRP